MKDDYIKRHYPFEGCFNFRDIGGYMTQEGKKINHTINLTKSCQALTI